MKLGAKLSLLEKDEKTARDCGKALRYLGFNVIKETKRGVHFEGEKDLFEKSFSQSIQQTELGVKFKGEPQMPSSIDSKAVSVYFPSPVTYFK